MMSVVDTALDVARAMVHLHSQNIVHSDLKARNVLLKGCALDSRGFTAKVADFGLSMHLDTNDTHISGAFQVGERGSRGRRGGWWVKCLWSCVYGDCFLRWGREIQCVNIWVGELGMEGCWGVRHGFGRG